MPTHSPTPPTLYFLDFDSSQAEDGSACWDAMASVQAPRWPEVLAEVQALLRWCQTQASPQPLEEGGLWDFDLQAQVEVAGSPLSQPLPLHWDGWQLQAPPPAWQQGQEPQSACWFSLSLTLVCHPSMDCLVRDAWLDEEG
ncbi:MAG: hypothetical protein KIG95_09150 [Comamonas sp.]|nr:hypothetical protein [Comamonas sp.]